MIRRMISGLMLTVLLICMAVVPAAADKTFIFPDSSTRRLTWEEVAYWDYETLGYAFNEIFARHGYDFKPEGEYEYYFSSQPWYKPNGTGNNRRDVYPYVSSVEWYNDNLIKQVREHKRINGDYGDSIWNYFSTGFSTLQGFDYVQLRAGQKLAVYSAPSTGSWRGANGKAMVNTNGAIYTAGWVGDWLLVMYETNQGSVRVGYVSGSSIRGGVPVSRSMNLARDAAKVMTRCTLTDDPARSNAAITTLNAGQTVTWLTRFYNHTAWDYVETTVGGKTVRGFVPAGSLNVNRTTGETSSDW